MDVAPMIVHGWRFELSGSELSITHEQDTNMHVQLGAQAAFSLLDYLYQYRDDLDEEARREASEETEQKKTELRTHEMEGQTFSE